LKPEDIAPAQASDEPLDWSRYQMRWRLIRNRYKAVARWTIKSEIPRGRSLQMVEKA
jgi:hypothetical protein